MRAAPLALREGDRERLEGWLRSSTIQAGVAERARVGVPPAGGAPHVEIAARVGVSRPTVTGWRARYDRSGIAGLCDEARSGRPRRIDHRGIIATTLQAPPKKFGGSEERRVGKECR